MVFHVSLCSSTQADSLSSLLHGFSLHLHFRPPFLPLSTSVLHPPLPPLWSWNIPSSLPPQSIYTCYFLYLECFSSHIFYGCSRSSRPFLATEDKTRHLFLLPNPSPPNHYLLFHHHFTYFVPSYFICHIYDLEFVLKIISSLPSLESTFHRNSDSCLFYIPWYLQNLE